MLEFANPRGAPRHLGPFERLCFEGETLVAEPGGVIANHADHRWHVSSGGAYSRLECSARVTLRFCATKHLQSRDFGPFEHFSSIDGVAYAARRIFAFCDRQLQDWYSYELGSHWKTLIVEPV